jgi:multidrug efflux system outer membrane protein
MHHYFLSTCMALTLSACMVGPDYERPTVDTPREWRFSDPKAVANVANTAWWQQFQDPVLNRLIQIALQENQDLKIAAARVMEFLGQYVATRAPLFPQLSGGVKVGRAGQSTVEPPSTAGVVNTFRGAIDLSYEIDLWGKYRRATEAAQAQLLSSEEGRRTVILSLVASVASAYTDLRSLDQHLVLSQQTLESRAQWLRIIELRFKAGIVSSLEVSQAQSDYETVAAEIPRYQKLIALQEDLLSILLGRNPGSIPRGRTLETLKLPAVPGGLPSDLLLRRPDIRQAEQDLIAANANIGVARAAFFPTLSLTSGLGTLSATTANLFTQPAKIWEIGATLTQPIFTGGALIGQLQIAEAQQQQLLFNYLKVIQTAFKEFNDALIAYQKTREQLQVQALQVEALQNYQRLARLRYDNGYVSYIDVLDADRQLFNAQISYTDTYAQFFDSLVNLYKAMGGGWVDLAEQGAAPYTGPQTIPDFFLPGDVTSTLPVK